MVFDEKGSFLTHSQIVYHQTAPEARSYKAAAPSPGRILKMRTERHSADQDIGCISSGKCIFYA